MGALLVNLFVLILFLDDFPSDFACMCIMNVMLYVNKRSDRYSVNSFLEQKVKMAEKYLGKARHYKRGNELFWKYRDIVLDDYGNIVLDDDGSLIWLNLRWTGYNDRAWLTKGYKTASFARAGTQRRTASTSPTATYTKW